MSDTKWTPGPWTVARAGWTDEGNVWYSLEGVKEACAPDGRLIAAAPDLYEALQSVHAFLTDPAVGTWQYMEGDGFYRDLGKELANITAALAKARGE